MRNNIQYINVKHLLLTYCNSLKIDEDSYSLIFGCLEHLKLKEKSLLVLDLKDVKFSSIALIDETLPKKSALYFTFRGVILKNEKADILFINSTKEIGNYLIEKDFVESKNVFVLSYFPEQFFNNTFKSDLSKEELKKRWAFCDNLKFLDTEIGLKEFVVQIIGLKIESFLINNSCITAAKNNEEHISKSTLVHVNKYVNLKPIIENFELFNETCFLLSELIVSKFCIPDFIVAPSKNAVSIASGLLRYFKTANILIINQVSPITALNNYSNIESINANAKYAVIEDFHCMGTEIKLVKGILWSHGVNVEENVYSFPIACTKIYDKDVEGGFKKQKIYPLYKLDETLNYKMFTYNSCPVCNKLTCNHRDLFDL